MSYPFLKGHGTENDFVVLPDADGSVHGDLAAERVVALCDRRSGIGADGVLRAIRQDDGWFMDYRNSDGSVSEMSGNGIRVFARYLHEREGEPFPMKIRTRDGIKVLDRAGLTVDDIDLFEINEAFASVVMKFQKDLNIPDEKLNVNGGAIAMGHPLGATGAMITGTMVDELERRNARRALVTLCIGGGMGVATIIERV